MGARSRGAASRRADRDHREALRHAEGRPRALRALAGYARAAMSEALEWRLGARIPAHDYVVFKTAFVEGEHPRTHDKKRFSLIESVDWVNVIALTADD